MSSKEAKNSTPIAADEAEAKKPPVLTSHTFTLCLHRGQLANEVAAVVEEADDEGRRRVREAIMGVTRGELYLTPEDLELAAGRLTLAARVLGWVAAR